MKSAEYLAKRIDLRERRVNDCLVVMSEKKTKKMTSLTMFYQIVIFSSLDRFFAYDLNLFRAVSKVNKLVNSAGRVEDPVEASESSRVFNSY